MGYCSDFSGELVAACTDPYRLLSLLEQESSLDIYDTADVGPGRLTLGFDRYDRWYDAEADIVSLVAWLRLNGAQVHGDVYVSGEERDDLWRVHVEGGVATTQRGRVIYGEE